MNNLPFPPVDIDVDDAAVSRAQNVEGSRTTFELNGETVHVSASGSAQRASIFLREELGLTGTKVGCGEGDCGSCSILVDGDAVYSCITATGSLMGKRVVTIEGLATSTRTGAKLQDAFLAHQAVQCGFCIPGMLMVATAAIDAGQISNREDAELALSGVLCRCTGYQKIVDAVVEVATASAAPSMAEKPGAGNAVGLPIARLDGRVKVDGSEKFGADGIPDDALILRAIRSPYHRARFSFGDIEHFVQSHPGVHRVLTYRDVPGLNLHGVATPYADQPVLPHDETRHFNEAVALVAGDRLTMRSLDLGSFPITWEPLDPVLTMPESQATGAHPLHASRADNILIKGLVKRGDASKELELADHVVRGTFTTNFVEHAYLEPEAGWAVRKQNIIEVYSPTQAPHSHRADLAKILGIDPENVHVIPTAVGGGFGGKLDMTVQPLLAVAAWHLDRPVGMILTREESISTSTKRHPAHMQSAIGASADGHIVAIEFLGDFNTGAYASWGTAVANRVPVHASGPYFVPHYSAATRAVHTNVTASGAFRGFGVPQTLIAQEQMVDALAREMNWDPLEFRLLNALRPGQSIATGQVLSESVGIVACLEALKTDWKEARERVAERNLNAPPNIRHGVGIAAFFYGCGNTAMSNPSTIRIGVLPDGTVALHQGAVDAGQGSNTVIPQIAADAIGIALGELKIVGPNTNLTPDAGRTSASRQTFVSGQAALLSGKALREKILGLLGTGQSATLHFGGGKITAVDGNRECHLDVHSLPLNSHGYVLMAEETFDPITTGLDASGRGSPYAVYAFGAQMSEVWVDCESGDVRVVRVVAAHDVGRAVNPTLLEGQIEGAVAQGVGMALMEKFVAGVSNNLHDYLIPTVFDMPKVKCIFIEEPTSAGPYGAKGIGEPALVPTAASIFNAIYDAIGVRITSAPATPEVVSRAIRNC